MSQPDIFFLIIGVLVFLWAVCDFLSEIPYRWGIPGKYRLKDSGLGLFLQNNKWIMGELPTDRGEFWNLFHKITFKIFFDGNHFFRNLPRILFTVLLIVFWGWLLGVLAVVVWFAGRELIFWSVLERSK